MNQTRTAFGDVLAAFFRLRREQGVQPDAESIAANNVVYGVPEHLRHDVGLPPTVERPPPVTVYLHRPW